MATRKKKAQPAIAGPRVVGVVVMHPLTAVKPNAWNPNAMTPFMKRSLRNGLEADGWLASQALLIWGTDERGGTKNQIIDGEHRWVIAVDMGFVEAPMVFLHGVTEAQAKALTIKLNGKRGEFTEEGLAALVRSIEVDLKVPDLGLDLGIENKILAKMLRVSADGSSVEDEVPEPPKVPVTKPGDLWVLGAHRLLCGDSKFLPSWTRLLAGEKVRMVWGDPPYGVEYVGKTEEALTIKNDALDEVALAELLRAVFKQLLAACEPGSSWYIAGPPGPHGCAFMVELKAIGVLRQILVWLKDRFVLGRSDYHYRHESIFYGWAPGAAHYFVGDRTLDSIMEVPRPSSSREHPTMKPVQLVVNCLENSSMKDWVVADPFGGSGTTLIACEQTQRRARVIELDPCYCDVIIKRWETLTGGKAVLESSGDESGS